MRVENINKKALNKKHLQVNIELHSNNGNIFILNLEFNKSKVDFSVNKLNVCFEKIKISELEIRKTIEFVLNEKFKNRFDDFVFKLNHAFSFVDIEVPKNMQDNLICEVKKIKKELD